MITEFPEKLTEELYYRLMTEIGAAPRWGTSNGKTVLLLTGLCHHSHSGHYSVIFDCSSVGEQKVTCMSECGDTVYWWNYIARALNLNSRQAKEWIIDWLNGKKIDEKIFEGLEFDREAYSEKPFDPEPLPMIPGIGADVERDLYSHFEYGYDILSDCIWHKQDGIDVDILDLYDIAIYPDHDTIILPHHNADGEIVGLYERNFNILRSEAKKLYPEMPYHMLVEYPRAKYVPLVKEWQYKLGPDEKGKVAWSFPNARNLYGLHLAKERISETGEAIIFEGAKSVMLARQYGYENAVASHTFGANENQIAMLLDLGATDIYFAFDKQYKDGDPNPKELNLYDKKTKALAKRIGDYCNVYRIRDWDGDLDYKDSPIDKGERVFDKLKQQAEPLFLSGIEQKNVQPPKWTFADKLNFIQNKGKKEANTAEDLSAFGLNHVVTPEQKSIFEEMEGMLNG